MPHPLLRTSAIRFAYDVGADIINTPPISLEGGCVVSLLGANMAGKTTLVRILSGHLRPSNDDFRVLIDGRPLVPHDPITALKMGIASVHQTDEMFPELSVWENIIVASPRRLSRATRNQARNDAARFLSAWHCAPDQTIDSPLRNFSGGPRSLVRVLRATLCTSFKVILLDEPSTGLDESLKDQLFDLIQTNLSAQRRTVPVSALLISHDDGDHSRLRDLAQRSQSRYLAYHLSNGKITSHEQ
jgi:ABC-type sugar transport system ATPase subunit